jgi:hypothetical protein
MERIILQLAAEILRDSYANCDDRLGVNQRFDELIPRDAQMLEIALREEWPFDQVTHKLNLSAALAHDY